MGSGQIGHVPIPDLSEFQFEKMRTLICSPAIALPSKTLNILAPEKHCYVSRPLYEA